MSKEKRLASERQIGNSQRVFVTVRLVLGAAGHMVRVAGTVEAARHVVEMAGESKSERFHSCESAFTTYLVYVVDPQFCRTNTCDQMLKKGY